MTQYRKPLNVVLALWIVSILLSLVSPFFGQENELLQDAKNLKVQVESLKSDLDVKKSSPKVSNADYLKLNDEISIIDKKAALMIKSIQGGLGWSWYSDLVSPLCSLIVAAFGLYINNKPAPRRG